MPPLRSDTTFLVLLVVVLLAALAITSMEIPGPPALAAPAPRPTPTATATPEPDWWNTVAFATPPLPALPGVPNVQLGSGGGGDGGGAGQGPVSFSTVSCPTATARIGSITRNGVWWLIDGSAGIENFWYWKMELSPDGSGWTVLYRSESPVPSGRLMEFNTTTVSPGQYQLRLTVVKKDGNYPEPCTVTIAISD